MLGLVLSADPLRKQEPQTEQERNRAAVRLRVVRTQMLLADQAGAPESTEAASLCESCCHMLGRQRAGPVLLTLAAHQNHSGIPLAPPQRRKGDRDELSGPQTQAKPGASEQRLVESGHSRQGASVRQGQGRRTLTQGNPLPKAPPS